LPLSEPLRQDRRLSFCVSVGVGFADRTTDAAALSAETVVADADAGLLSIPILRPLVYEVFKRRCAA
jgi:hypothetical protein